MQAKEPWSVNWSILRKLGKGGQGFTHEVAHCQRNGLRGGLKRLNRGTSTQERGRMVREGAILRTLSVEGLKVPHVIEDNMSQWGTREPLYFVMEFIPGNTLAKEIEARRRLPLDKA